MLVASGIEMGAVIKALGKVGQLSKLGAAAQALHAGGDVADFSKTVQLLEKSSEIDAKIAAAAERAAQAKKALNDAGSELVESLRIPMYAVDPGAEGNVFQSLVKMASAVIQRGFAEIEIFMLEVKQARIAAGLGEMTEAEVKQAQAAWEEAREAKTNMISQPVQNELP